MVTFLFWNVNGKRLEKSIVRLAHEQRVDVLMLAELALAPEAMRRALNADFADAYYLPFSVCTRVAVYTRFPWPLPDPVEETSQYSMRQLVLPERMDITLVVAHLRSKLHRTDGSQAMSAIHFAERVRETERAVGHTRTVLVGDLNMNPWEPGVVAAPGLNAAMTRQIANKGSRVVESRQYPFFYNPMWSRFGDGTAGPPGTYYCSESDHVAYFWHMLDQVLIRPALLDRFPTEGLRILTADGRQSLLSRGGCPGGRGRSDHLPVLFTLDI